MKNFVWMASGEAASGSSRRKLKSVTDVITIATARLTKPANANQVKRKDVTQDPAEPKVKGFAKPEPASAKPTKCGALARNKHFRPKNNVTTWTTIVMGPSMRNV